jgi:hypothetical protein
MSQLLQAGESSTYVRDRRCVFENADFEMEEHQLAFGFCGRLE